MRVHEQKKDDKKVLAEGNVYDGVVETYEIISFNTKNGTGYGLKLKVKPTDDSYFRTTAFDFIGMDADGPYIYKDSKMRSWLCRLFGTDDLAKVIIEQVKGKPCRFTVKNEMRSWTDKATKKPVNRLQADIDDMMAPIGPVGVGTQAPVNAVPVSVAASQPKPAAPAAVQPTTVQPAAPKPKVSDDWSDGESL